MRTWINTFCAMVAIIAALSLGTTGALANGGDRVIIGKMDFTDAPRASALVTIPGRGDIELQFEQGKAVRGFTLGRYCREVLEYLRVRNHPDFSVERCITQTHQEEGWQTDAQADVIQIGQPVWVISPRYNDAEDFVQIAAEGHLFNVFGSDVEPDLLREALGVNQNAQSIAGLRNEVGVHLRALAGRTDNVETLAEQNRIRGLNRDAIDQTNRRENASRFGALETTVSEATAKVDELATQLANVFDEGKLAEFRKELEGELGLDDDALLERINSLIDRAGASSFADLSKIDDLAAALEQEAGARQELANQVAEHEDRLDGHESRLGDIESRLSELEGNGHEENVAQTLPVPGSSNADGTPPAPPAPTSWYESFWVALAAAVIAILALVGVVLLQWRKSSWKALAKVEKNAESTVTTVGEMKETVKVALDRANEALRLARISLELHIKDGKVEGTLPTQEEISDLKSGDGVYVTVHKDSGEKVRINFVRREGVLSDGRGKKLDGFEVHGIRNFKQGVALRPASLVRVIKNASKNHTLVGVEAMNRLKSA